MHHSVWAIAALAALTIGASACGNDEDDAVSTDAPVETEAPVETDAVDSTTEAPAVTTLDTTLVGEDDTEAAVWSDESEGPGRFRTDWFAQPFTFTVGDSWVPAFTGAPDNANIRLPGVAIFFVLETTAASVDALIADLSAIEGVELTDEEVVEVGEQAGVRYVVAGDYEGAAIPTTAGEFTFGAAADEANRITVLELDGSVLLIVEVTAPDDPETGWAETAAVIETITWG